MPRERFAQLSAQALRFLRRRRPADRPFERGAAQQLPAVVAAEHQHMARSVRHRSGIHHHRRLAADRHVALGLPFVMHRQVLPDVGTQLQLPVLLVTAADQVHGIFASVVLGRKSRSHRTHRTGTRREFGPFSAHGRETPESVGAVRHAVNVNLILISQCGRGTETRRQLSRRIDAHRISDGRQRIDRARLPLGSQPAETVEAAACHGGAAVGDTRGQLRIGRQLAFAGVAGGRKQVNRIFELLRAAVPRRALREVRAAGHDDPVADPADESARHAGIFNAARSGGGVTSRRYAP